MKYIILLGLILTFSRAFAATTPECKDFEVSWRKLEAKKDLLKVDEVLELLKTYLGAPARQNILPDWQGTAKEKLKIIYAEPLCTDLSRYDAFKFVFKAKLKKKELIQAHTLLFDGVKRLARNGGSLFELFVNRAVVSTAIENHKLALSEAEAFEWNRINNDIDHLHNEVRLENYDVCTEPDRCSEAYAQKTLQLREFNWAELMRIHSSFCTWAEIVKKGQ